jgi:hypothetical protein
MHTGIQITLVTIGIVCGLTLSIVHLKQKSQAQTPIPRFFNYPGARIASAVEPKASDAANSPIFISKFLRML